ncbi:MAG: hypothetical protein HUJ24_02820 [Rhodobacteraceae bacterium]|nr:hypothetical protein [Paracoccaceae bacterium]
MGHSIGKRTFSRGQLAVVGPGRNRIAIFEGDKPGDLSGIIAAINLGSSGPATAARRPCPHTACRSEQSAKQDRPWFIPHAHIAGAAA